MLEGLTSVELQERGEGTLPNHFSDKRSFLIGTRRTERSKLTSVNDPMDIVQVHQPLQHGQRDIPHDVDVDGSNLLVNPVQRALVHKFHVNAGVGIRDERAVKRNDVRRIAIVHDLKFPQDLFPHRRFCVDQHDPFVRAS